MTDLERVREYLHERRESRGLEAELDAHLKEDAERDAFEHRLSLSLQKERNDAEAELTRMRRAYDLRTAQRDTLLAALREAIDCLEGACPYLHGGTKEDIAQRLRAAIAKVEGEKGVRNG